MKLFFFFFFLIVFSVSVRAQQEIKSLPVQFNQYMRAYPQINPASSGDNYHIEIYTGNQRHGQNWSNIHTFYLNANMRFYRRMKAENVLDTYQEEEEDSDRQEEETTSLAPVRFHVAGINITSDKEGSYFNRSGLYGMYAWHSKITQRAFISGGFSLGIKNISISENYIYGSKSGFAPDGNIGIWLYDYDYHIGISAGQIFNSKIQPLYETTRLLPNYNITAGKSFAINSFVSLKPSFLIRVSNQYPADIDLSLGSLWQKLISGTVNYRHKKGMAAMLGIERITIGENNFRAMISYNVPFIKSNQINNYTYEITLNYFFARGNRVNTELL
jgi:type IX secretion system PorP/SprF family membrane protein